MNIIIIDKHGDKIDSIEVKPTDTVNSILMHLAVNSNSSQNAKKRCLVYNDIILESEQTFAENNICEDTILYYSLDKESSNMAYLIRSNLNNQHPLTISHHEYSDSDIVLCRFCSEKVIQADIPYGGSIVKFYGDVCITHLPHVHLSCSSFPSSYIDKDGRVYAFDEATDRLEPQICSICNNPKYDVRRSSNRESIYNLWKDITVCEGKC